MQTMAGADEAHISTHGDGLANAGQAILADARAVLADREASDGETVHALRRTLKRWRALMRLLEPPIGDEAVASRLAARDLMRMIAGARDAQGALDALNDLNKGDVVISGTTCRTLTQRLTDLRGAAEATSLTPAMRARVSGFIEESDQTLARWPLKEISIRTITNELMRTYRRARQLTPANWFAVEAEHLHDLRRRVVEHRHQMDLVEPLWPRLGKLWGEETQRLRDRLGTCQDLAVLEGFTAQGQPLARWRTRLKPAIDARRDTHLRSASRIAGRLFAERPKAFRARLLALAKARHARHSQEASGP